MSQPITQDHLRSAVREIIEHFNQSQSKQDERIDKRFDLIEERLDSMSEDITKIKLAVVASWQLTVISTT